MSQMSLERRLHDSDIFPHVKYSSLPQPYSSDSSVIKYLPMGAVYINEQGKSVVANSDRRAVHEYQARQMDDIVRDYTRSKEGRAFHDYARSCGHTFIQLIGAGTGDLGEHTVAAVIHDGKKGIIVSNYDGKDFRTRVSEFASQYGLKHEAALEYVLTHEFGHVAGYNTESSNEGFIKDYFLHRAAVTHGGEREKYKTLAEVAGQREQEAQNAGYTN
ncbi:MAG TPA: hypothetical protein VJI32_03170 [Candidatus Nanoarchaeia archaeon]|nr:hypothetical protein [Candidatus Nanoarchaeia archaeon]